jgi:hypothetical protein
MYFSDLLDMPCNEDPAEDLLYQFQMLLAALKNSDKQAFNPKGLCHAYKDMNGKPVNVTEQMDADEFLSHFLDKIEKHLEVMVINLLFDSQNFIYSPLKLCNFPDNLENSLR